MFGRQPQRRLELREQWTPRIFEVFHFRGQSVLFDLRPQHVLQRDFAHFVLRAGKLFQIGQQVESLLIDANFRVEEVKLVIGLFQGEGRLQHARLKREVFHFALRRGHVRRSLEFARPRKVHHQSGHQRRHV